MRADLSVVIICKNAAGHIGETLRSVLPLGADILLYDSGSTDATLNIASSLGVPVQTGSWQGFGRSRNAATQRAEKDWILTLDADEALEKPLLEELCSLPLNDAYTVYRIHLNNYLGNRLIKHGAFGGDRRIRIFNRKKVQWNTAEVHEKLLLPDDVNIVDLKGSIHHRTAESLDDYRQKLAGYAIATAEIYFKKGKKAGWLKRYLAPAYTFLKNYLLKAGFLDGYYGWMLAHATAVYTFDKYRHLYQLQRQAAA